MSHFVLGILGRAGSGKTTAARYYAEKHGATIVNFADALKEMCGHLFDLSEQQLHGALKEVVDPRYGATPRDLMIRLGHGGREIIGSRTWIDACFCRIKRMCAENNERKLFVIGDVRYPNEAQAIVEFFKFAGGGCVIKLDRRVTDIPTEKSVDEVPEKLIWQHVDNRNTDEAGLHALLDALPRPWE